MDQARLKQLLNSAVESGICSREVLDSVRGEFSVEIGEVARRDMTRIYKRRLTKSPDGSKLQRETSSLMQFLEAFPDDALAMISIRPESGGFQLLLADVDESRILFWMRMFSQY